LFLAYLGSLWLLCFQNGLQYEFQYVKKKNSFQIVLTLFENEQVWSLKRGSKNGCFWDRRLKAFFTRLSFFQFFSGMFLHDVLEFLGCLLGVSWASCWILGRCVDPKTLKTIVFFKVF
jgi:hypothetical protein